MHVFTQSIMKRKFISTLCLLLAVLAMAFICTSCSKDFNSNAEYKDVTVVYGILNPNETDHYIKIYKAFLTDSNAYEAAQVYDSLYYFDKINAVVEEYVNGRLSATFPLTPVTDVPRDSIGDFASPDQLLYKFSHTLNPSAIYKLVITNLENGRVITAETSVVGSFYISKPSDNTGQISIHNTTPATVECPTPQNACSYDIYQTFFYIERNRNTGVEVTKSIRRKLNQSALTRPTMQYQPALLLEVIAGKVEPNEQVDRYITVDSCLRFEVWAVNEPLYNYVANNTISGSVVLDRLTYTNILCDDGRAMGIFGSRRCAVGWHGISTPSQEELVHGELTGNLNFHYAYEYLDLHNN